MMQVLSPLSQAYDTETTGTWVYRLRKIQVYRGDEYIQQVYSDGTAGNFIYGEWQKTARTSDIPTGLPLGSIFAATVPILNDSTVHLLDGSTITQTGIYAAFATYLKSLQSSYPNLFTTETLWQNAVTINGECGKFVIDNTAGTIRLPKIINFIQGTVSLATIGDAVAPGIPNIKGVAQGTACENYAGNPSGAFYRTGNGTIDGHGYTVSSFGFNAASGEVKLDGTYRNDVYGKSDTVQPRSILYPYYIVLATAVKTQTVVNIDNVANDINQLTSTKLNIKDSKQTAVLLYEGTAVNGSTVNLGYDLVNGSATFLYIQCQSSDGYHFGTTIPTSVIRQKYVNSTTKVVVSTDAIYASIYFPSNTSFCINDKSSATSVISMYAIYNTNIGPSL